MLTQQPLAQYKGILRADGENQRKSEGKPGQERRKQHGRQINREWQAKNARTLSGRARQHSHITKQACCHSGVQILMAIADWQSR